MFWLLIFNYCIELFHFFPFILPSGLSESTVMDLGAVISAPIGEEIFKLKAGHIFGAKHIRFDSYPLGVPVIIISDLRKIVVNENDFEMSDQLDQGIHYSIRKISVRNSHK